MGRRTAREILEARGKGMAWVEKKLAARRAYWERVRLELLARSESRSGEAHPEPDLSAEEIQALIDRDAVWDEQECLSANPLGRDTYYERINGGPWQRRY